MSLPTGKLCGTEKILYRGKVFSIKQLKYSLFKSNQQLRQGNYKCQRKKYVFSHGQDFAAVLSWKSRHDEAEMNMKSTLLE